MSELVNLLGRRARRRRHGLKGAYDLMLEWTPQLSTSTAAAEPEVSIFTALQEQLGLRLEPIRAPASVVVVDSVAETPSEN